MGWLNPSPRTLPAVPESAPARIWRLKISRAIRRYSVTALQRYPRTRMGHPLLVAFCDLQRSVIRYSSISRWHYE